MFVLFILNSYFKCVFISTRFKPTVCYTLVAIALLNILASSVVVSVYLDFPLLTSIVRKVPVFLERLTHCNFGNSWNYGSRHTGCASQQSVPRSLRSKRYTCHFEAHNLCFRKSENLKLKLSWNILGRFGVRKHEYMMGAKPHDFNCEWGQSNMPHIGVPWPQVVFRISLWEHVCEQITTLSMFTL